MEQFPPDEDLARTAAGPGRNPREQQRGPQLAGRFTNRVAKKVGTIFSSPQGAVLFVGNVLLCGVGTYLSGGAAAPKACAPLAAQIADAAIFGGEVPRSVQRTRKIAALFAGFEDPSRSFVGIGGEIELPNLPDPFEQWSGAKSGGTIVNYSDCRDSESAACSEATLEPVGPTETIGVRVLGTEIRLEVDSVLTVIGASILVTGKEEKYGRVTLPAETFVGVRRAGAGDKIDVFIGPRPATIDLPFFPDPQVSRITFSSSGEVVGSDAGYAARGILSALNSQVQSALASEAGRQQDLVNRSKQALEALSRALKKVGND
jgi:hypothetical protein